MRSDKDKMILSTLDDIQISLKLIIERCVDINSSDDFLDKKDGLLKLDIHELLVTTTNIIKDVNNI